MKKRTFPLVSFIVIVLFISSIQLCFGIEEIESKPDEIFPAIKSRSSFYASGRTWVFYLEKSGLLEYRYVKYKSSVFNSSSWGSATILYDAGLTQGTEFGLWYDGTYVLVAYFERHDAYSRAIYFRRGTPNSDGTISWYSQITAISPNADKKYINQISVCRENGSDAHIWLCYHEYSSGSGNLVTSAESSTSDGTGSWTVRYVKGGTLYGCYPSQIVPLEESGTVLFSYGYNYASDSRHLMSEVWNGTAFVYEIKIESDYTASGNFYSVMTTSKENEAYMIYTNWNNYLRGRKWNGTAWSNYTVIETGLGTNAGLDSCLTWDTTHNILYAFYVKNSQVRKKQGSGSAENITFSNEEILFNSTYYTPKYVRTYGDLMSGRLFIFWQEGQDEVVYYLLGDNYLYYPEHSKSWLDKYFMIGYGLVGLILMVFAPTWVSMNLRKKIHFSDKIEKIGIAVLIFCIGFGLFISWLGA